MTAEAIVAEKALTEIGGKPEGYLKTVVNPIGANKYRVNIYVVGTVGDLALVKTSRIAHSLVLTA